MYDQARERVHTAFLCRTPIDPLAKILSPGLMLGNTDLQPAVRADVPAYRDCTVCAGSGNVRGHWCQGCKGFGRIKR